MQCNLQYKKEVSNCEIIMRLSISRSVNSVSFYVIEDYTKKDGTRSSRRILKLGTEVEINNKYGVEDLKLELENMLLN